MGAVVDDMCLQVQMLGGGLNKGPVIRVLVSMLHNLPSFQKVLLLLLEKRLPSLKISHRPVSSQNMPVKKEPGE
ncbi:hypothetical protein AgCh_039554 [Apium graveolens]